MLVNCLFLLGEQTDLTLVALFGIMTHIARQSVFL